MKLKRTRNIIFIAISVIFASLAGGIGELIGQEVSGVFSSKTGAQVVSSTGMTSAHRDAFVKSCIDAGSSENYCTCTFNKVKEIYSPKDLSELYQKVNDVNDLPQEMKNIMVDCWESQ